LPHVGDKGRGGDLTPGVRGDRPARPEMAA